jgi:alpha-L-rhamnosidase
MDVENNSHRPPVGQLRCEYASSPLGIDLSCPRLSWQLNDKGRGVVQAAYQIRVANEPARLGQPTDLLWDSGKTASPSCIHMPYGGPPLAPRTRYWWTVRSWNIAGQSTPWAEPAWWETGLLGTPWQGRWIGRHEEGEQVHERPCAYLRREFTLPEGATVTRARTYITARGLYELRINGQRVSEDYFRPGWTEYHKRLQYQTYDITAMLQPGDNVIAAVLGDGWYRGNLMWRLKPPYYGRFTRLLAQVEIDLADGSTQHVTTDNQWRVSEGPIRRSDFYNGEDYDARLLIPGWDAPGFDDSDWADVVTEPLDDTPITAQIGPCVQRMQELEPKTITEPQPGVYVFDLGQNMVGFARLHVTGPSGHTVQLRFAEMLQQDGTLYTEALRSAKATDTYTLRGNPAGETYEPSFTFHGFRYIEITNWPDGRPDLNAVTGVVLHTAAPESGHFATDNDLLNQLQSNIVWGQRGNYLEVPTDCPQRNERLGWTGDAQVFIGTGCFNMDVASFFTKWQLDLTDAQFADGRFTCVAPNILNDESGNAGNAGCAAWADAGVICPWTIYLRYGDTRILEQHYDAMARWIDYQQTTSNSLIRPDFGYGDWLNIDDPTPRDLIGTAYFAYATDLVSKVARVVGNTVEAIAFAQLGKDIRAAYDREFITAAGRVAGHSQTAYLLTIAFDLAPDRKRDAVIARLIDRIEKRNTHLSTGFVGTPLLLPTLTRIGRLDLAYRLLLNETYPSWLYPIHQGATTMWERWNAYTHKDGFGNASMNSFNHYAYGAVGQWMYENIAGLHVDETEPAYQHTIIQPRPGGGINRAEASYDSMYGRIETKWAVRNGAIEMHVTIPPNTRATVHVPTSRPEDVTESGRPAVDAEGVYAAEPGEGELVCRIGSGSYAFAAPSA